MEPASRSSNPMTAWQAESLARLFHGSPANLGLVFLDADCPSLPSACCDGPGASGTIRTEQAIPDPDDPGKSNSGMGRRERLKTGDLVEVGNQVWLFILFDRPAALRVDASEIRTRSPIGIAQYADRAEPASIAAVGILDILEPQFLFHGEGEPIGGLGVTRSPSSTRSE